MIAAGSRPGLRQAVVAMLQCNCTKAEIVGVLGCKPGYVTRISDAIGVTRIHRIRRTTGEVLAALPDRVRCEIEAFTHA